MLKLSSFTVSLLSKYYDNSHISQILFCGSSLLSSVGETIIIYLSLILWVQLGGVPGQDSLG